MSSSSKNSILYGFLFVAIFVAQQVLSFVWDPYRLVSLYWIAITVITFIVGFKLPLSKYNYTDAFKFALVCAICSIPTFLNGTSIGEVMVKMIFIFIAYIGYVMLNEKRLDLRFFDVLLVILYIVYYIVYFSKDIGTRLFLDGDLFGHSSSNTIAITLNIILWLYFLLNYVYEAGREKRLFVFSLINLVLIVIQGSRAGIIIALLLTLMIFTNIFSIRRKWVKRLLYVLVFGGAIFLVMKYLPMLEDVVDVANMQGVSSFEEDVRSAAQATFFLNMNLTHALIGYESTFEFAGVTRTFNAFLDFWNTFGLIPMIFLLVAIVKRITRRKEYELPLLYLTPILAYSLVESLWGGTLWDIIIFICLFWPKKSEMRWINS